MAEAVDGLAIQITAGNVRNRHVPISHIKSLFPPDCFGGATYGDAGSSIEVSFSTGTTVETDIDDTKGILRVRAKDVVGDFYDGIGAKDGTRIFVERTGPRAFRISAIG